MLGVNCGGCSLDARWMLAGDTSPERIWPSIGAFVLLVARRVPCSVAPAGAVQSALDCERVWYERQTGGRNHEIDTDRVSAAYDIVRGQRPESSRRRQCA
jgi:hypothetical protein